MPMQLDPSNPINNTVEEDRQNLIEAIDNLIEAIYIIKNLFAGDYIMTESPEYESYDHQVIDRARTFLAKFEE